MTSQRFLQSSERHSRTALLSLFAAATSFLAPFASAQTSDESSYTLDTLVVTAARHETLILESPVAISTVTNDDLLRQPTASIAELVRDIPGVFVADNTIPGMQRLRIRGEDARRSLVLIDGLEVSDHSTYGPPLLVSPALVERIEVVRGPHSTLYGSRASGGVINIITKEPESNRVHGSFGSAYSGATDGHRIDASITGSSESWYYQFAAQASRDGLRKTPSGPLRRTAHESDSFLSRVGWRNETHDLSFAYDRHDMISEASVPRDMVDGFIFSKFELDLPRRDRETASVRYDGWQLLPNMERLSVNAYTQTVDRNLTQEVAGVLFPITMPPRFYDYFNNDFDTIDTLGLNIQADWRLGEKHRLVSGINVIEDEMDKRIDRTGFVIAGGPPTPAPLTTHTQSRIETKALFLQDTFQASERLRIDAGIRQYDVDSDLLSSNEAEHAPRQSSDQMLVANAAASYQIDSRFSARLQWGQGYVYPTLLHLHTGSLFGQGRITRPNRFLIPETSDNFELGLRFQNRTFTVDASLFVTQADDYIATVRASEIPELGWGPSENTYANLDSARSQGVEFLFEGRLPETPLELYAQGAYLTRTLEYSKYSTDEYGQPKFTARAGIRFERKLKPDSRVYLDGYIRAGGESRERTSRSTRYADSWETLNLSTGVIFGKERQWRVSIDALNLTDEEYRPSTDELVQPGRHANLGLRLNF